MRLSRREFLKLGGVALAACSLPFAACADELRRVPVLAYGDVSHRFRDELTIPPPLLAAQLEWLYTSGHRAGSVGDLMAGKVPERGVVLTFDNGYASFMNVVFPLLRGYGFRATLNLTGDAVGSPAGIGPGRPLVSWEECRLLAASGLVELGSCTFALHRRASLRTVPAAELEQDLALFQETLQRETGQGATVLAWPYGIDDPLQRAVARAAGFSVVLTRGEGLPQRRDGITEIPRQGISGRTSLAMFRSIIAGKGGA